MGLNFNLRICIAKSKKMISCLGFKDPCDEKVSSHDDRFFSAENIAAEPKILKV
jgi:hypothetical protein